VQQAWFEGYRLVFIAILLANVAVELWKYSCPVLAQKFLSVQLAGVVVANTNFQILLPMCL